MTTLRKFATPLTIASFTIVGVTGVLWYFHQVTGVAKWMHEVIGLAMVVIVALHVILNWRAFQTYFKRPLALVIVALGLVLTMGAYVWPDDQAARGGPPNMAAVGPFADETLATLAPIYNTTVEDLMARLEAAGITRATAQSTIEDLVGRTGRAQMDAFSAMAGNMSRGPGRN